MTPPSEHQFPPRCPGCNRLLADTGTSHCKPPDRTAPCGWVVCKCGITVDTRGNHSPRKVAP